MASEAKGYLIVPVWYDSTTDEVKPVINDDGRLPITIEEIIADINNKNYVYDGSSWVKSPIPFGYTDRWVEQVSNLNAGVGTNLLYTTAVPAGYVYTLNAAVCFNLNSVSTQDIGPYGDGMNVLIVQNVGVAAGVITLTGFCNVPLKAGDMVRAGFTGCTAGDNLYLRVWGYKTKVNM